MAFLRLMLRAIRSSAQLIGGAALELYTSVAAHFDGTGTNYLSSDGEAFGISDEISFGAWVNMDAYVAPPSTFAVNSADLNGTSQYFVSTNVSNYNFGTDSVFVSGWVKSGENYKIYFKGNETGTSGQDLFINTEVLPSREIVFDLAVNVSNRRQWVTTATPIPNDGNWHHVAIYHARTNDTTQPVLWVDGVSQGAIPQSYTIGSGWASANFTQTQPMKLGITAIPAFYGVGTGVFVNTIKGYSPIQADIDELYNGGIPKCYADVNPTLKARFMSFIDCGTYNGRTEVQALTEHVESELFTNVNNAPFTGTGLSVECTPSDTSTFALSAFNAKNNNETAYTTGSSLPSLASLKSSGFSISCFVNIPTGQDGIRLFNMRADPSDTSLVSDISVNVYSGVTKISFYNGSTSTTLDNIGPVVGEGLTHVGFTYEGGTDTVTPYINGVQSQGTQVISTWNATSNSNVLVWCGANVEGYTAENPNGMFAMPRLQNRKITATEMLYLAQNPSVCYDDMDNTSGLKDATIYAPTLGEYNGSTNQALVDPASGTTTVVSEPVDYDGTGLSVECTPSDTSTFAVNSADMNNGVTDTYYTKTPTSSTDMTVGVYVKFRDVTPGDTETLYEEIGSDNLNYNMSIRRMTNNKIRVFWANTGSGGQIIDSTSTVTSGVWYYILVRKTLTSTQIYINTSLDKDQATTGSMGLLPSTSATIGRHFPNGARRLNGSISFIEIFDSAISDTEINELHSYYADTSDEVTCYEDRSQWYKDNVFSFNRMSNYASNTGEETDDLSGNGRVLTAFGSIPYTDQGLSVECAPSDTTTYPMDSMTITTGHVEAPSNSLASLEGTSQTWSIQFKLDSVADVGTQIIWTNAGIANARSTRLYRIGSSVTITVYPVISSNSSFWTVASSTTLTAGEWHTITVTATMSGDLSITVNGTTDTVAMGAGWDYDAAYPIELGSTASAFQNTGAYGSLRVWDRVLSAAQISELELSVNDEFLGTSALSSELSNGLVVDVDLGNYDGGTTPLVDHSGTLTFAEVGTVTYVDQGLSIINASPTPTIQGIVQKGEIDTEGYTMSRRIENGENLIDFNLVTSTSSVGTFAVNSANLNGSSQYFVATQQGAINNPTTPTICIWLKRESLNTYDLLISKHGANIAENGYYLGLGVNDRLDFAVRDNANNWVTSSDSALLPNTWYYIELKVTGTAHEIWINGSLDKSTATTRLISTNSIDLHIGNNSDNGVNYVDGSVYGFELYNRPLTSQETSDNYNNGLPLCFEEKPSSVTADCVYAPRLGNYSGNAGQELVDQSSSSVTTTNNGSTPFTGTGLSVECGTSSLVPTTISSTDLATGQWKFLAATYNNVEGLMRLYVDGVNVATSANIAGDMNVSANDLLIGNLNTLDGLFQGCLMFPFVANKKFIDSQISLMYNGGNPIRYEDLETDTDVTTDMVGHWNLADWNNGAHTGDELLNNAPSTGGIIDTYYRTHKEFASFTPSMTVSSGANLLFSSTTSSLGGMYYLVQVKKSDIDGNDLFINWSYTYSPMTRIIYVYDGLVDGSSPIFINGSAPAFGTPILSKANEGTLPIQDTVSIPDLSSYGEDITLVVKTSDNWADTACDFNITEFELRTSLGDTIENYLVSSLVETGTDGESKYGAGTINTTITNDLVDNGSIPFDCTGVDVASSEDPTPTEFAVNSSTFNGSTSYIEAPAPLDTSLNIGTQEFSTLLWMKSTNTTNVMQVINCDSGSGSYYDFYTFDDGGAPTAEFRIQTDRIQINTTSLLDGAWHLVGLIRDNAGTQGGKTGVLSVVIYGVLQTPTFVSRPTNLASINAGTASEPITFGRRSYTNNQYFDGSLDFPSIHVGTVLTPAQLLAEYNAGVPKCLEDSPNNATITEAWDLGTYTGSRGSLIGLKGVQDLTTETAITYVDQGLSVECSS